MGNEINFEFRDGSSPRESFEEVSSESESESSDNWFLKENRKIMLDSRRTYFGFTKMGSEMLSFCVIPI